MHIYDKLLTTLCPGVYCNGLMMIKITIKIGFVDGYIENLI